MFITVLISGLSIALSVGLYINQNLDSTIQQKESEKLQIATMQQETRDLQQKQFDESTSHLNCEGVIKFEDRRNIHVVCKSGVEYTITATKYRFGVSEQSK
jgi:hypothetical protein